MATASPTPMGQGSHFTSLGRRTSARQALQRPPSRSRMGTRAAAAAAGASSGTGSKRNSTAAEAAAASGAASGQQYSTLHDSSDDEMPIPMKLSALTKALLSDGASASDAVAAVAAAEPPASIAAVLASGGPAMGTRRHSHLTRSASSTLPDSEAQHQQQQQQLASQPSSDRPGVRQTRRTVRASSVQASGGRGAAAASSSRPTSPLAHHQDSSPAPRKRVVRLSAAAAAAAAGASGGQAAPPPLRRSLSASRHSRRAAAAAAAMSHRHSNSHSSSSHDDKPADTAAAASADASAAAVLPASSTSSQQPSASTSTPAGSVRRVQIAVGSSGRRSSRARLSGSGARRAEANSHNETAAAAPAAAAPETSMIEAPATAGRTQVGSASRYGAVGRSGGGGSREADVPALPSSMRVKRVGKVLGGGFLSGPARRGRWRTSDQEDGGEGNNSPEDLLLASAQKGGDDNDEAHGHPQHDHGVDGSAVRSSAAKAAASSFYDPYARDYAAATGSPVSAKTASAQRISSLRSHSHVEELRELGEPREPRELRELRDQKPADIPSRPAMPSTYDQENEPYVIRLPKPLMVKEREKDKESRDKENRVPLSTSKPAAAAAVAVVGTGAAAAATPASPEQRKVLAAISRNTPHRPAPPPPPPKMTVLQTATGATAGTAATTQANKRPRILLKVNGRPYQRVDCVGRGGSGKVYRVTAENGKMFALKRVSLENTDETTIRGFLGEIDLLKKLSGVDRVIQLYDYELNKEKQMLSLLMELGEMDLNSLLRVRQNPESAHLDPVFVRFYWKEMLECLQAVHAHDIVHSDLKPANFVLVQGRLKLIDFGIANAIQTDETVNVHRETQIGTPNYMSPESLMDAQQYAFTAAGGGGNGGLLRTAGAPKLMKLGKPSDVWSLGCILYQMVYGLPPFGHIQNQMARCQAIITWTHAIDFPARGLGGALVPASLLATMRRCLNREQHLRPTCADLLAPNDPFLYPEVAAAAETIPDGSLPVSEELLARIIQSVVSRCRERMPTEAETIGAWPAAYWASVRRAVNTREER